MLSFSTSPKPIPERWPGARDQRGRGAPLRKATRLWQRRGGTTQLRRRHQAGPGGATPSVHVRLDATATITIRGNCRTADNPGHNSRPDDQQNVQLCEHFGPIFESGSESGCSAWGGCQLRYRERKAAAAVPAGEATAVRRVGTGSGQHSGGHSGPVAGIRQ